jgi:F-type H+-transporting ATPase subunit epsilon
MADKDIHYVVVTPEAQIAEGVAQSVVIPAHDGELGILRDRAPLMCELGIGQMRYTAGGRSERLFIDGGFAQVNDNDVTVLTPRAVPAEKITNEMVAEAEQAARADWGTDAGAIDARMKAHSRASVLRGLRTTG